MARTGRTQRRIIGQMEMLLALHVFDTAWGLYKVTSVVLLTAIASNLLTHSEALLS